MKKFLVAIDQGTTSTRAILFDLDGNIKFTSQFEFNQYFPKNGWVEHNPNEIWLTTLKALKKVIKKASLLRGKILSIGITNQRETTILWNKKTGKPAREIPKGLKSQWKPPTGKNLDFLTDRIFDQTKGFRFQEGTMRRYKYSIRDSMLNLRPGTTYNLEKTLRLTKGVLDHTVGLSATFDIAPGYTELYQNLEAAVNTAKANNIDKPFGEALRAALEKGDFSKVDAYNKTAAAWQKKNPGVDVPFIRKGGDPKKLITYFDDMSPEARENVLKIAEGKKGLAIETKGMTIGKLLDNSWCPTGNAYGGRIGFASGSGCPDSVKRKNFLMLTNDVRTGRVTGEAAEKIAKNAAKVVAKVGSKSALASILGPAGIGIDLAYEVGSIGFDMAMDSNVSLKQALQNNWLTGAFIPGTSQEEYNKGLVKFDSSARPMATIQNLIERKICKDSKTQIKKILKDWIKIKKIPCSIITRKG